MCALPHRSGNACACVHYAGHDTRYKCRSFAFPWPNRSPCAERDLGMGRALRASSSFGGVRL
eukprot:9392393-Alexandrium_andersonii.AAC.1